MQLYFICFLTIRQKPSMAMFSPELCNIIIPPKACIPRYQNYIWYHHVLEILIRCMIWNSSTSASVLHVFVSKCTNICHIKIKLISQPMIQLQKIEPAVVITTITWQQETCGIHFCRGGPRIC